MKRIFFKSKPINADMQKDLIGIFLLIIRSRFIQLYIQRIISVVTYGIMTSRLESGKSIIDA